MNRIFIILGKLSRIFYYLQHPEENPKITAVALGILVVIGFLIAALLFLIYVKITTPPKNKPQEVAQKRRKRFVTLGLIILFFGLIFVTYESKNAKFCGNCHGEINKTWSTSSHKDTSCFKCHQSPGFLGYSEYLARGSANLASYYRGNWDVPIRGYIDNNSCLRCHEEIKSKTISSRGILVSHKEFLQKGQNCASCHGGIGHKVSSITVKPTMESCVNCHNGKQASAKCSLCHVVDIAKTAKSFGKNYARATTPQLTSCKGCHTPKTNQSCIKCMGFEMPHPEKWGPPAIKFPGLPSHKPLHPAFGFKYFEKCMKCHDTRNFCDNCHQFPANNTRNHGPGWLKEHGKYPKNPTCGCHRPVPSESWCQFCHGSKFQRKDPGDLKYYNAPAVE